MRYVWGVPVPGHLRKASRFAGAMAPGGIQTANLGPVEASGGYLSVSQLNHIISRFEIGDPIRTLFKPVFSLAAINDGPVDGYGDFQIALRLDIWAPDADNANRKIKISLTENVPVAPAPMIEKSLFYQMRKMLHKALLHEADESIKIDGNKIFDPHRNIQNGQT